MGFIYDLIRKVFEWALFLALLGGLGEATTTMYHEAGRATAQGLVSLTALNRSLVGDRESSAPTRRKPDHRGSRDTLPLQ